jgi:hypothetical protein
VVKADDAIAQLPALDTFADGDDRARRFVTENLRRRDEAVLDFLDVSATNAAGGDVNQNFARGNFGHGNGFDDDASRAAIHGRAHSGAGEIERRVARMGCGYGFGHVVASNSDFAPL